MDVFTDLFPEDLTFEKESRLKKARKITAILKDYFGDLSGRKCLDLGCSVGHISAHLAEFFGLTYGVDVDKNALGAAKKNYKKKNLVFKLSSENRVPFKSNTFDVVVFNQIYEHVNSPERVFAEIKRVLKKGGVCFFGARNKYFIFDGHYPIPFIAMLPRSVSNFFIKTFYSKRRYDINLYSLSQLKELTKGFALKDYTLAAIKNPRKFSAQDVIPTFLGVNRLFYIMGKIIYGLIPNYLWVLIKK